MKARAGGLPPPFFMGHFWVRDMQTLPPCGLGGAPTSDGECVGFPGSPSDAGGGVFSGISGTHAAAAIISAGAILAGLLFAVWATRKVARFFRGGPGDGQAWADKQNAAAWRDGVYGAPLGLGHADAGFSSYGCGDADAEWDTEDDSPDDYANENRGQLRLEHGK